MFTFVLSFITYAFANSIPQGSDLVMNVAYQSCAAAKKAPLNQRSPALEGVRKDGQHENGIGDKFIIEDLAAVQRTHYYIKDFRPQSQCYNVYENPLVYDYGGKPYTSIAVDSKLNLFRNAGSGTEVLGIDCSGFVFSALAVSGHRLSANKDLKASQVYNVNAAMFMNPKGNGLTCLDRIKVGKAGSLHAGDIIASKYHVAIVYSVGKDPLGIESITWAEDCDRITPNDFNFVLAHSAPNKGAIGIQKIEAKDFIAENFFFYSGMIDYARTACHARLNNKNVTVSSWFSHIVRHNSSPNCKGRALELEGTSCLGNCQTQ